MPMLSDIDVTLLSEEELSTLRGVFERQWVLHEINAERIRYLLHFDLVLGCEIIFVLPTNFSFFNPVAQSLEKRMTVVIFCFGLIHYFRPEDSEILGESAVAQSFSKNSFLEWCTNLAVPLCFSSQTER